VKEKKTTRERERERERESCMICGDRSKLLSLVN
jgi:ribosomal protein S14